MRRKTKVRLEGSQHGKEAKIGEKAKARLEGRQD
jgi:hypothetical protein